MDDKSILFFCIVIIAVFIYRIILSILLLSKKKNMIDEKFYIALLYVSLVGILVLFTNWLIVGFILILILPIVLTLYISFSPTRIYWIINGFNISESTFVNKLVQTDDKYKKTSYRVNKVRLTKKKKENKIKLEFLNVKYQEKEELLKIINNTINENTNKSNKKELFSLLGSILLILAFCIIIIIVLFT